MWHTWSRSKFSMPIRSSLLALGWCRCCHVDSPFNGNFQRKGWNRCTYFWDVENQGTTSDILCPWDCLEASWNGNTKLSCRAIVHNITCGHDLPYIRFWDVSHKHTECSSRLTIFPIELEEPAALSGDLFVMRNATGIASSACALSGFRCSEMRRSTGAVSPPVLLLRKRHIFWWSIFTDYPEVRHFL